MVITEEIRNSTEINEKKRVDTQFKKNKQKQKLALQKDQQNLIKFLAILTQKEREKTQITKTRSERQDMTIPTL